MSGASAFGVILALLFIGLVLDYCSAAARGEYASQNSVLFLWVIFLLAFVFGALGCWA